MEKIVKSGEKIATVQLDGSECAVKFSSPFRVFSVKSDSDVVVAIRSGAVAGEDGVLLCKGGDSIMLPHMRTGIDTVYLTGSGSVTVAAGNEVVNPFKAGGKGGGSNDEFGVNFSQENLFAISQDFWGSAAGIPTAVERVQVKGDDDDVVVTISGDLSSRWYLLIHSLPLKAKTLYKLRVDGYTGYGRVGLSSFSNGAAYPYDYENRNAVVICKGNANPMTNDNHMVDKDNVSDKFFYLTPDRAQGTEVLCAFWLCTDENREDTSEYSFKIGLYEQEAF